MKKQLVALAAATTVILGGTTLIAPAANADTQGCVTRKEFRKAKPGMARKRVHNIFDTSGKRDGVYVAEGIHMEMRSYNPCAKNGMISVEFTDGKLSSKSAYYF